MNIIGRTTEGDLIVQMPLVDNDRLAKAIATIEEVLMGGPKPAPAPATPAPTVPPAASTIPRTTRKPKAKKGCASKHGRSPATACARCNAPRATTPWPKAGRFCKACAAAIGRERYAASTAAAKAAVKPGATMRAAVARDVAAARTKKTAQPTAKPHGADRIRVAMARIEAGDGLPREGGRTLPILAD